MDQYDIFISCKSEDYEIAEKVYSFLTNNGFSVFLASQELRKIAITAYMDSISKALDSAYSMIVVSTKKEYLESEWVKLEWSTFLCEILSKRKTGQIMTLVENIEVGELPTLLRTYQSFALKNYEDLLPYLEKMKKPEETNESTEEDQLKVNNERAGDAEVHIETDIACRVVRFQKEFVTAQPKTDNLIHLKKGKHKLTFISLENEQDSYSEVCIVKDDCEFLQVSLTKIRDARLAKEEAERKIIALEDANRDEYRESGSKIEGYDIFISCKSEDYEIGEKVYSFLKDNGFRVFLSSKELRRMAQADYMDAISVALDTAYSMIVISTKKEYLKSIWVKFEWSTFLNEILSRRKNGQIMTLLGNIKVSELPIQLRKYNSFDLENYEAILPYIKKTTKPKEPNEYKNDNKQNVNNAGTDAAEVHIETDIACRVMRFKEELITAVPDDDNLILLKNGTHKLTFVSIENEQDNYSQVYTVKDDCEFLQVSLAKIRDTRIAKEEAERRARKAERKRLAEDDARYQRFNENGKEGFKKDSVVVIPAKYNDVSSFCEGLSVVKLNSEYGFIDKSGKEVIPIKYDYAFPFSEGLAAVKLNAKYGYIDKSGKEVIPFKYDEVRDFCGGLARVKLNGRWGYIDPIGKDVIPFKYDDAGLFCDGLASVKIDGKWGYIDKSGVEVIPIKYDYADSFSEGLASVELDLKWGYIDKSGKEVIPIKYDNAIGFSEGLAEVDIDGKWSYIDKSGKEAIPFKYDLACCFSEGLAAVYLNGKWGYIDKRGKEVIPIKYDNAMGFSEGLAEVMYDDKYGYIDRIGNVVIPIKFNCTTEFKYGKAEVELGGKWGIIDKEGNFTPGE